MIKSSEEYDPVIVEIIRPITNLDLQVIEIKGWNGQVLKLGISLYEEIKANKATIQPDHGITNDKKILKKIAGLNQEIENRAQEGALVLILENYTRGNLYIAQVPKLFGKLTEEWDFAGADWKSFSDIFVFSLKIKPFILSFRSGVEALLLKNVMKNKNFKLLNENDYIEESIQIAEHQLKDEKILNYYQNIKDLLKTLNIKILED